MEVEVVLSVFFAYLGMLFPMITLATAAYFLRRLVGAMERRAEANAQLADLRARLADIENSNEELVRDVLRLQAAQEFSTRLLGERLGGPSKRESAE